MCAPVDYNNRAFFFTAILLILICRFWEISLQAKSENNTLSVEELNLKFVIWLGEVSYIPSADILHSI